MRERRSCGIDLAMWLCLALTFAWIAVPASAQITSATLSGTVQDETGGVLPGSDIQIKNLDTGATRSAVADERGQFTIPGLPPGRYDATVTLQGFTTQARTFALAVAQEAGLTFVLKVGIASENVSVVAAAVLVDTRSAALSALVTKETIDELPLNGRNYIDLALLQPGVTSFMEKSSTTSSNKGTRLNINGMTARSNSYLLDGANMRGYAGTSTVSAAESTLGIDTMQEFRVVTNAYGADYGRSMGGVISIVTKSGTNDIHGSAFEFHRDSKMDARNFFDGAEPPPFRRNQFGGSIGGPIKHNRAFFLLGAERLQEDLGGTSILAVPTQAVHDGTWAPFANGAFGAPVLVSAAIKKYLDLYPLPNGPERGFAGSGIADYTLITSQPTRENFLQGRVDLAITQNDSIFLRHTFDKATQALPVGFEQFGTNSVSRNQFFTTEYKRILSSSLLNTLRFSHSRLVFDQDVISEPGTDFAFIQGQPTIGNLTVTNAWTGLGSSNTNPSTNDNYYWTWTDDLSYTRGRHLLKTGALVEHVRSDKYTGTDIRGSYRFPNITRFLQGLPDRFTGVLPGAQLNRERPNNLFGVYVQDDFRANPRLTLNLGLRYEFYTMPADNQGLDTTLHDIFADKTFTVGAPFAKNPSLGDVAPRFGFAWDVKGDGRTAVRGGAGVYHDSDGTFNSAFGIASFSPPFASSVSLTNPAFPGPNLTNVSAAAATARTLDYHIKQPYAMTYNVNVQRELGGSLVASIGYAGSHGYNLLSAIEGNPNNPTLLPDGTLYYPPGTAVGSCLCARRNPNFGSIDYRTNGGRSVYNSLQTTLQKRLSHLYQFQVSYTLSKSMDNTQAQLGADAANTSVYPMNPLDRDADWARSDFDVRHVLTTNFVWELPGRQGNILLSGWQINGIWTFRTGVPFEPTIGSLWSGNGNDRGSDRPNVKPGVNLDDITTGNPDQWFDPNAFVLQRQGTLGNAGRNSLTAPNFNMLNLVLARNAPLGFVGKGGRLQLRFEVFNVLNHANFAAPSAAVFPGVVAGESPSVNVGRVTRTVTTSRQLQLGVKVSF